MAAHTDWAFMVEREKRSYDRAMTLEEENSRFKAALRDIASFKPIPNGREAFDLCVREAKRALGELDEEAIEF